MGLSMTSCDSFIFEGRSHFRRHALASKLGTFGFATFSQFVMLRWRSHNLVSTTTLKNSRWNVENLHLYEVKHLDGS